MPDKLTEGKDGSEKTYKVEDGVLVMEHTKTETTSTSYSLEALKIQIVSIQEAKDRAIAEYDMQILEVQTLIDKAIELGAKQ